MKTETDPLSNIRSRLPYTDRRVLSQAWYDALHLAPDRAAMVKPASILKEQEPASRRVSPNKPGDDFSGTIVETMDRRLSAGLRQQKLFNGVNFPERPVATGGRLKTSTEYPQRTCVQRERFSVRIAGTDVQLLIRAIDGRLEVIAVCRSEHRAAVQRAVDRAVDEARVRGRQVSAHIQVERRRGITC
ncbi:MAG TPA: hypothetical protein VGZ00_06400 [Candidatus Baltobacteraceae bacterium]|jgi:hypothetical protein|nr:hypothetical protein [Candidatus Baltobacteraceae bacterium]